MMTSDYERQRQEVVEYLRQQLVGPAGGPSEILEEPPLKRYSMGIIFPQGTESGHVNQEEEQDNVPSAGGDDFSGESPVSLAFQRLPASMGISFFLLGDSAAIKVDVWGARYEEETTQTDAVQAGSSKKRRVRGWQRVPIAERTHPQTLVLKKNAPSKKPVPVLDDRAGVHVQWRPVPGGHLVTVTLLNMRGGKERADPSDCICQSGFRCWPVAGSIGVYPHRLRMTLDAEDEELALMYSSKAPFAVGHGCAAVWESGTSSSSPPWVEAEVMPTQEVKPITTTLVSHANSSDVERYDILRLQHLTDQSISAEELERRLTVFVDGYAGWIESLRKAAVPPGAEKPREWILDRLNEALLRIRRGVQTLCDTSRPDILRAFRLANLAMFQQMIHSGKKFAGTPKPLGSGGTAPPNYDAAEFRAFAWRPFQLAFQLLSLNSLVDETPEDRHERELVDLIWFPTGGGKTEAYLALAAFEIIYRRIKLGSRGGGTAVIKRYTLRLLTTQQFERAATLITALELMRKTQTFLGDEPIRLGLWVGGDTSPNRYSSGDPARPQAKEVYENLLQQDKPENPFQLQKCPWCGTRIVPEKHSPDPAHYGVEAGSNSFRFFCPDTNCVCHASLPISVVDEDLYERPPSLLIGTIDKFARMAWDPASTAFFGGTSARVEPPTLIIQDELHLISGPLGTIAGVYESAIDTVIKQRGRIAKVIAATATIRRAAEQVERLYARPVRVFPPSGIDASNSYFARVDESAPGRLYVGVMAQGHTRMYSLVMTAGALAQAPVALKLEDPARDAFWTQVIYHNSRRELGKTMTLARDDVVARIDVIESVSDGRRKVRNVEELSANVKGPEIPRVLDRLKVECATGDAVDILPCTNMISVGVDVSRLGLMLIYGQPKTTSEYIQASSRVGRDASRPPGIVVTLYAPTKPRDRSHYEAFKSYHQALYRYVEPTSVTPYAPPARDRALHAALVILLRHVGGLVENASAARFDPADPLSRKLVDDLLARMQAAEPREAAAIAAHLNELQAEWAQLARTPRPKLHFSARTRQFRDLLGTFDNGSLGTWPTLNSMRNVDQESLVRVIGKPS